MTPSLRRALALAAVALVVPRAALGFSASTNASGVHHGVVGPGSITGRTQLSPRAVPISVVATASSVAGHTTYRLSVGTPRTYRSSGFTMYAMFGTKQGEMRFPKAWQVGRPFGANIGGVSPAFFRYSPDAAHDSWLSCGVTDGTRTSITSIGIDFSKWASQQLSINDGAVFWLDPSAAGAPGVVAQLTVPQGEIWTAVANAQGKTNSGHVNWRVEKLVFTNAPPTPAPTVVISAAPTTPAPTSHAAISHLGATCTFRGALPVIMQCSTAKDSCEEPCHSSSQAFLRVCGTTMNRGVRFFVERFRKNLDNCGGDTSHKENATTCASAVVAIDKDMTNICCAGGSTRHCAFKHNAARGTFSALLPDKCTKNCAALYMPFFSRCASNLVGGANDMPRAYAEMTRFDDQCAIAIGRHVSTNPVFNNDTCARLDCAQCTGQCGWCSSRGGVCSRTCTTSKGECKKYGTHVDPCARVASCGSCSGKCGWCSSGDQHVCSSKCTTSPGECVRLTIPIPQETNCFNGIDDDKDGKSDCEDSDCKKAYQAYCSSH